MPIVTAQFPPSVSVANLNGVNGFAISGFPASSGCGSSVRGAGDVNGDGVADLIIGALDLSGVSYVLFGKSSLGSSGSMSISSLNGSNGFAIAGFPAGSYGGSSVSGAGDVNDDGIVDLIIGVPYYYSSSNPTDQTGAGYVLFGQSGIGSSGSVDVSSLSGANGFIIAGFSKNSESGSSISAAGDVNGDGIADLIIGANHDSNGAGASYVLFGQSGIGSSGSVDVSSLNGSNGFAITGFPAGSWGGNSVSGAGDVNSDGIMDLIIGAPLAFSQAGVSYVLFGQSGIGSSGNVDVSSLTGSNGFTITGFPASSWGGNSVSGAGDVNGDGIADLIIGAPNAFVYAGASYILFGKSGLGSSGSISVSSLTGSNGFAIIGFPMTSIGGCSVSGAGDVNNDGIADLIIGAPDAFNNAGTSYVIFGKSGLGSSGSVSVSNFVGSDGFAITGFLADSYGGKSVSGTGDLNNDGIADLIIGAPDAFNNAGASYVIFGESTSLVLSKNKLTIKEDQTLTLSSIYLNATNPKSPLKDSKLQFTLSGIQHGRFYSSTNISLSLKSFTQQQVRSGQIYFAHDGSGWAPSYNVSVGYPGLFAATSPQESAITFQQSFILVNNNLTINQGQTVILTSNYLSANDLYNSVNNPNLIFSVNSVQHGYFALISAPSAAISTFTQTQILNGKVQFVHDGSINPPSYNIAVIDGAASIAAQAATISFDAIPIFINNNLIVNEGQAVVLTTKNFNATNPYNPSANLMFSVIGIQHGYFALTSAPSTPITSFSQVQVQSGFVQFTQDGTSNPPGYNATVSDGRTTSSIQAGTISFDVPPVLATNTLTINQRQTVVLSLSNLSALDPYTSSFTFTVSNVQHGYFALTSAPITPITIFTQAEIQSSSVQFVQDGSINPPSYSVSVSDGRMTSAVQAATISFDVFPTLVTNTLTINQGQSVVFGLGNLSASNPYTSSFTFMVSNVQHGYFALTSAPATAIITFTLTQIQSSNIQFSHDGSIYPPAYNVVVTDGRMSSVISAATISFDRPPVLHINRLTVNQDQSITLTSADLSATDPDNPADSLIFMVSNAQHGHFSLLSNLTLPILSFTQAQIQRLSVQFVTDGSAFAPSYDMAVSDGRMTTAPQAASISFDAMPAFLKNQLIINQGQTVVLSPQYLSAWNPYNTAANLIFTVSHVQNGIFSIVNATMTTPITSFTPAEIQAGKIQFTADGNSNPPSYEVTVSDGRMTSLPQASAVFFDVTYSLLEINQGQTVVFSTMNFNATHPKNLPSSLTFLVVGAQNGYFAENQQPLIKLANFTQWQLQNNRILFVSDGSVNPPSYQLTVSYNGATSIPQAGQVQFNAAPILQNNYLIINQGQTKLITSEFLSATDTDDPTDSLEFVISNMQYGQFELLTAPSAPLTHFTQGQVQNGQIQFVTDGGAKAPIYYIAVSDGKMITDAQSGTVIFNAPTLINNRLLISQGQTVILSAHELNAASLRNYTSYLRFNISHIQHAYFSRIFNPLLAVTRFTQAEINKQIIQVTHDGSTIAPSYQVSITDGISTTPLQPSEIDFNTSPILLNNWLSVMQGQPTIISTSYLNATDLDKDQLTFSVSKIQQGYFALSSDMDQPITNFTQNQVTAGNIVFVPDGSSLAPSYQIAVSDGYAQTSSSNAVISFEVNQAVQSSSSATQAVSGKIIGGTASGAAALLFFGFQLWLRQKTVKNLQNALDETGDVTIRPIAKKVFERLDRLGFLNYCSLTKATAYVNSVKNIVDRLKKLGVIGELSQASAQQQSSFINEIARQVKKIAGKEYSYCSTGFVCSFFKAEVTPEELRGSIDEIVAAVQQELAPQSKQSPHLNRVYYSKMILV